MEEVDLKPVREAGAKVVFDCPNCDWGVEAVIGGPGADFWETVACPNSRCNYRFGIRWEVETK